MNRRVMLMGRVVFLTIVLWAILFLAWPSLAKAGETKLEKIHMGSFSVSIDYAPYLIAKEKGWFEQALKADGVSLEYTTFQTLPSINESFATKRIDIVFEAEVPAIIGRTAGVDIRIYPMLVCTVNTALVVPSSSKVASIPDLQGKKVAVLSGTGAHYGLIQTLTQSGLSKSDIAVVNMIPPDAKAAFETGAVDAWAIWPPWVEQEVIAGLGRTIPEFQGAVQTIMAVRGQFADQHPKAVSQIVEVLNRAKEWLRQNPAEAQNVISQVLDLPLEVVIRAWPQHDWAVQFTPQVLEEIQAKADFLKAEGFLKTAMDVKRDLVGTPNPTP